MGKSFALIVVVSLFLLSTPNAEAEIMVAESLEWLTDSTPHVGEYQILEATPRTVSNWFQIHMKVKLISSLKGDCPKTSTFKIRSYVDKIPELKVGTNAIFFLTTVAPEPSVRYKVSLNTPPKRGFSDIAYSKDFRLLIKGDEIRSIVKKRAALKKNVDVADPEAIAKVFAMGGSGAVRMEVPFSSTAYQALYGGSSCFLVVPADPELKEQLLKQSKAKNVWERRQAAWQLSAFPDDVVRARLTELLEDPGTAESTTTDAAGNTTKRRTYPVRDAAREALKEIARVGKKE